MTEEEGDIEVILKNSKFGYEESEYDYEIDEEGFIGKNGEIHPDLTESSENELSTEITDSDECSCSSEKVLSMIDYEYFNIEVDEKDETEEDEAEEEEEEEDEYELNLTLYSDYRKHTLSKTVMQNSVNKQSQIMKWNDEERLILVKFITDTCEIMKSRFKRSATIEHVKKRLAYVFRIDRRFIELYNYGVKCDDQLSLLEFYAPVEFLIRSKYPHDVFAPGEFSRYIPRKYVVNVHSALDVGGIKSIPIVVDDQACVKEWLGGYRNPSTKIEYHNANAQTLPRRRSPHLVVASKITQTPVFPLKDSYNDTTVSKATQTWRTDFYMNTIHDKIVETDPDRFQPGKGFYKIYIIAKIIIRLVYLCKRVHQYHLEQRRKEMEMQWLKQLNQKDDLHREINRTLISGTTFPTNRKDFYNLYLVIGKWWYQEHKKIQSTENCWPRKLALGCELLRKEHELLSVIERQRIEAKKEVLLHKETYFLETCARPLVFNNAKGNLCSIDTLESQNARQLMEIISAFKNNNVSFEIRMDILSHLKNLLMTSYQTDESDEIISLLDRERELLLIGTNNKHLKPLRLRIFQLLMHCFHNPSINPASKNFKKPGLPKTDKKYYKCIHCGKIKQLCDFTSHVRLNSYNYCTSCAWIENVGHERKNLEPYQRILECVRQSEANRCCSSSVAFVLQPVGLRYLVTRIWGGKSVLSEKTDLNILRMARFRIDEEWSPWNCILLTDDELIFHQQIDNVYEFYNKPLLDIIHWRHLRAKNEFMSLILNEHFMQESKHWANVQDIGAFLHPSHVNKMA